MSPAVPDLLRQGHIDQRHHSHQHPIEPRSGTMQVSSLHSTRLRSSDSWIEIPSEQSSSSHSSATNDTATIGLRVQHDSNSRRRRRRVPGPAFHLSLPCRRPSVDGSSQEEYEESESESDRVMTSSNEGLQPRRSLSPTHNHIVAEHAAGEDEADENAAAIGKAPNLQCFTPQPNAFSHPPSSHSRSHTDPVPGSYFPSNLRQPSRSAPTRHSHPGHDRQNPHTHSNGQSHTPYTTISPSHQADHDAALRASLSTLLSCAAAARGLPKSSSTRPSTSTGPPATTSARIDPATLRMLPESAIPGSSSPPHRQRPYPSNSAASSSGDSSADKGKRKAAIRSSSKDWRAAKKPRRASAGTAATGGVEEGISPTLLTWVTAAGVVVLVSALSFSTGYVIGRETGRLEGSGGLGSAAGECGREAGKGALGLKRLRWGSAAGMVSV